MHQNPLTMHWLARVELGPLQDEQSILASFMDSSKYISWIKQLIPLRQGISLNKCVDWCDTLDDSGSTIFCWYLIFLGEMGKVALESRLIVYFLRFPRSGSDFKFSITSQNIPRWLLTRQLWPQLWNPQSRGSYKVGIVYMIIMSRNTAILTTNNDNLE